MDSDRSGRPDVSIGGPMTLGAASLGNLLVIGVLAYAAWLRARQPDLYNLSVQEDAYIEWASFWAFLIAALFYGVAAWRQHREGSRVPWFHVGVGAFCLFVAMEEISWGQRVFGYRPPTYFLEHNFQQELNLHNVVETAYRKLAVKSVILGYGVLLPLVAMVPFVHRVFGRFGIAAPRLALAPAFLATFVAYEWYPWRFTGEWVELMMGLGFLFAGLTPGEEARGSDGRPSLAWRISASWLVVVVLGGATDLVVRWKRDSDPRNIEAAGAELEALRRDFDSGRVETRCGLHKRLYTFVEQYGQAHLREGEFAALVAQGLPEKRAEFFLDPWNSPYWVRDRCGRSRGRARYVYSLGPNRRRDSPPGEIDGDDIGAFFGAGGE